MQGSTANKAAGVVLVLIGLSFIVFAVRYLGSERFDEIERRLSLGMTESEVRLAMKREPSYAYDRLTAPQNYYVDGWAYRERPITDKVWIYICGEPICYIWFDAEGVVEDLFVGGS